MKKLIFPCIILSVLISNTLAAPLRVENFVRVKGLEATEIIGWGIVSGLPGTGDDPKAYSPAALAMLRELNRTGQFGTDIKGISAAKNSALVKIVATIPDTGARDGDALDCTVYSAGNAKSLSGGILSTSILAAPLQQDENTIVQAIAQGRVTIEQTATPTVGRVVRGCRLRANFLNPYIEDGLITLVIEPEHARPNLANKIAEAINKNRDFVRLSTLPALAINPRMITVSVPVTAFSDPMDFLANVLDTEVMDVPPAVPRITINERTGFIGVGEDVEFKPTAITYNGFVVDMAPELQAGEQEQFPRQFVGVDSDTRFRQMNGETVNNVKLRSLISCLDELRATPRDTIEIIKGLKAQGAIVGEVVFVQ